ncbi:hypothetical protein [Neptuniibacter marinus]|uniref:hypothetical protein n=2 Tax=Neptuniibacter TaxID=459520 RepID=UPI0012E86A76|nr:hypothetical protein [Neptuniibacter marinus]
MMEVVPKIADIKTLRELSKVLIIPLFVTAYLSQSGFSIFGLSVQEGESIGIQLFQFIAVFSVSVVTIGFSAWGIHDLLLLLHIFTHEMALKILSLFALSFGLLGLFGHEVPLISNLSVLWFYTSLVCGFYFLARAADIEQLFT